MKEGTTVKVIANVSKHGFDDGEIVRRKSEEYDHQYNECLGFIAEHGEIWYMIPEEYEVVAQAAPGKKWLKIDELPDGLWEKCFVAWKGSNEIGYFDDPVFVKKTDTVRWYSDIQGQWFEFNDNYEYIVMLFECPQATEEDFE